MTAQSGEIDELHSRLGRFPLWNEIPGEILHEFCAAARLQRIAHKRPLFLADKPSTGLFLVRAGEFKVTLISAEGREQILYLADRGKIITEAYLPSGAPVHCSAFARGDSEAWELPSEHVTAQVVRHPSVALALLESVGFRSNRHIDLIFHLSLRSVERRLAAFIFELAKRANAEMGKPFVLPREINVSTVACLLGTVREEVTRAQTRLQKRGIVEINRRQVIIHDLEALEALVHD